MRRSVFAGVTIVLALSSGLLAQPVYHRTAVVDPTAGAGNYQTIADAIHAITPAANEHWTLRLYPGVYTSPLTLGGTKERIDLEGVDRDSVIIQVTGSDAVVIESGDELSRMNALRNLTIKTVLPAGGMASASSRARPFQRTS